MAADYKQKYVELRTKFVEATDVSFRLGYEQGMKDAMMQQAQQQVEQAEQERQMQEQAMMQGGEPGQEGMPPEEQAMQAEDGMPMEEDMTPEEGAAAGGSELDQNIEELQGLVAKGEKPSVLDMRKAVEALADLRKSQRAKLSQKTKADVSSQKKLVTGLLKKWEDESKETSSDLEEILKQHDVQVEE